MRLRYAFLAGLLLLAMGCSVLSPSGPLDSTPNPQEPSGPTQTPTRIEETEIPEEITPTPGPVRLVMWLPPQFAPQPDTESGRILQQRLDEFSQQNPDVIVEVRIKTEDGPGGLVDGLTTASASAPLVLPDLVALPFESLQAVAIKGLLNPYDELTDVMTDGDWYSYAQELSRLDNRVYGLPFAGDMQILVHRPDMESTPPMAWGNALVSPGVYGFTASDPGAVFTLSQYLANGGAIQDEDGNAYIDQEKLTQVLTFYQQAEEVQLMPDWLTQYQTDEQLWDAYEENRMDMVVTWSSRYLDKGYPENEMSPILTPDGRSFTLSNGWVWALTSINPDHHELSSELGVFLTETNFLSDWTEASGYLPPRPSAMRTWSNFALKTQFDRISASAQLIPTIDILAHISPELQQATISILRGQSSPDEAAAGAAENISQP